MKILTIGKLPKGKIWHGTCQTCKSTAEAKESELENTNFYYGNTNPFTWVICPVCNAGPLGGMRFSRQE